MLKLFIFFLITSFFFVFSSIPVFAQENILPQEEKLEAVVIGIVEEKEIEMIGPEGLGTGKKQLYQKLELLVSKGSLRDQQIIVENGNIPLTNIPKFKIGDEVVVNFSKGIDGNNFFTISDYIRRSSLLWLFIIFIVLTIVVARVRGATSLLGLAVSFFIIFTFILPQILSGRDPVLMTILGSLAIIPATFYLSHGFNKKTTVAVVGTLFALVVTGILANIFVEASKLTGFVSEEAGFLQVLKEGTINIKGLLLAGIIIGVLGVLDDVTVSQSSVVEQLKKANPRLSIKELYQRAMSVGQDHIASMVNTLVLVYTGAAMPLLLLFINSPHPFSEVINYEIVADEVIRTLVGSIGLILAVPLTSLIAAFSFQKNQDK